MKQTQNALWTGSIVSLLVGGWLIQVSPCRAQFGQPGQIQGGQNQGGFQIKTLPSVTGGYLGNTGFTNPSPFNPSPFNNQFSPGPANNQFNPSPYNNQFNSNFPNTNNTFNFNNPNAAQNVPGPGPLFQQQQFNNTPWMPNQWNNMNNMMLGVGQQAVGQWNPFMQFPQNGVFAPGNNMAMNPGAVPFNNNFGGFGGIGAGQFPGVAPMMNQGGFGGFGGFGGGNPFFWQ